MFDERRDDQFLDNMRESEDALKAEAVNAALRRFPVSRDFASRVWDFFAGRIIPPADSDTIGPDWEAFRRWHRR